MFTASKRKFVENDDDDDDDDNDLVFYIPSTLSKHWNGDDEKLCAMKRRTVMRWIPSPVGLEPGTSLIQSWEWEPLSHPNDS